MISTTGERDSPSSRDLSVDLLRGIAIALMIGANTVPFLLLSPAPALVRFPASLAAPLFILLAGMMVTLSVKKKKYGFSHLLLRGGLVIAIAAVLDVAVWDIIPFLGMDVLYLIGIALPLTYLFLLCQEKVRRILIVGIFCIGPVFWFLFGYPGQPIQIPLVLAAENLYTVTWGMAANSWLLSGWFPVFPWLGFAFLGAELGMVRWGSGSTRSFATLRIALLALGSICTGAALWELSSGPHLVRFGYVELFYPAAPGFCFLAAGLISGLFVIADSFPRMTRLLDPLRAMGECSLAIYIIHIIVIAWVIAPAAIGLPLPQFLICATVFVSGMCAVAYLIRYLRQGPLHRLRALRFLTG
jgi:Predicted membrane protein